NFLSFHYGGLTSAFDLAVVVLLTGLALLSTTWQENRGEGDGEVEIAPTEATAESGTSPMQLVLRAIEAVSRDPSLLALMAVVTGFESAMYGFIFSWTPALTEGAVSPPALGSVFATLMLAYTSGSLVFQAMGSSPQSQDNDSADVAAEMELVDLSNSINASMSTSTATTATATNASAITTNTNTSPPPSSSSAGNSQSVNNNNNTTTTNNNNYNNNNIVKTGSIRATGSASSAVDNNNNTNNNNNNNNNINNNSSLRLALPPLRAALIAAPFALLASALGLSALEAGSAERTAVVLGGFVAFEFCCGLYNPAVSAVKGALVPETLRSTIYSTYRAPMNAVVLAVLLWGAPPSSCLVACAGLLGLAALAGAALPATAGAANR
ncbi:unnamed protein product, partial [Polarella glacialis]